MGYETVYNCKMCGAPLNLIKERSVCKCEYCGNWQTIPAMDDEKKINNYDHADRLLRNNEFDRASEVYEMIVANYPSEAVAYWGIVLCKYGIEYVEDTKTSERIPTCHRASYDSILDDDDYKKALSLADYEAKQVYEYQAGRIEDIRKRIIDVSKDEPPYDCFICYKETDQNDNRTEDSVIAQEIYDKLTEKGYRVFFSRITLEDKLGVEYEPYIFAALNSAKVMVVVGTRYDYFEAVWVKNEWGRYLKIMNNSKDRHIIPCYKYIDPYGLPKELSRFQAQDFGKIGASQDLVRGIEKLISKRNVSYEGGYQRADLATLKDNAQSMYNIGNYKDAKGIYKKITQEYPKDWNGWWGLVLCEYAMPNNNKDINSIKEWYGYAYKLGDKKIKDFLEQNIVGVLYGCRSSVVNWNKHVIMNSDNFTGLKNECSKLNSEINEAENKITERSNSLVRLGGEIDQNNRNFKISGGKCRTSMAAVIFFGLLILAALITFLVLPSRDYGQFVLASEHYKVSEYYSTLYYEYLLKYFMVPGALVVGIVGGLLNLGDWFKKRKVYNANLQKVIELNDYKEKLDTEIENLEQYTQLKISELENNQRIIFALEKFWSSGPDYLENFFINRTLDEIGVKTKIQEDPRFKDYGDDVLGAINM